MATEKFSFLNSSIRDLDLIFSFFESAVAYQQRKGYDLWPQFGREMIQKEIEEGRHWKIVSQENIVCVYSVLYSDPLIWKERDTAPSVYLHRIAVNPLFKGRGVMREIKTWAIEHAKQKNKKYVRMDTWGGNENLRKYYMDCGFTYLGQQFLEVVDGLPAHYGGSELSLFQIEV